MDNEKIDREILEAIKRWKPSSLPGAQQILSQTSVGQSANREDELWRVRLLAKNGMVEILGDLGHDFGVRLGLLGEERLSITEEEYQRRHQRPLTHNTTEMEFHNSSVGNVAQVVGSHGTTINQTQGAPDLQSLTAAIDRLVEIIKNHPSISPEAKKDAEIEAEQLKGEVQKSKPSPSRIQQALDWFKALDGAATVLPHVIDLADKLKGYLPGVL